MILNLEKYKTDLDKLIDLSELLFYSIQKECLPGEFEKTFKATFKEKYIDFIKKLPRFSSKYQDWYSESLTLIKQLLPDRIEDFVRQYVKPKTNRKDITFENYVIEDYLQGLKITRGGEEIVGPSAAMPRFRQQCDILKSVKQRFESSLFDIKQLVQADLFDSELDSSKELAEKGYLRGAGAIAGVILEKHLSQVCLNHGCNFTKKDPTISDYNDKLRESHMYEIATRRKIQHLGDLRNLCDHHKKEEPKSDEINDLISGVNYVIKNVF